jgi:hypothetical protein
LTSVHSASALKAAEDHDIFDIPTVYETSRKSRGKSMTFQQIVLTSLNHHLPAFFLFKNLKNEDWIIRELFIQQRLKNRPVTSPVERPLWRCPRCQRRFANRNQSHSCGRHDLKTHFDGKPAEVRAIFDAVLKAIRRNGPVTVLPEKTRIAFHVRMSFAQLTPRVRWVEGHVVLARRLEHPRFRRIDTISPRNHVHHFRLSSLSDVDEAVKDWLTEAYAVGQQRHLKTDTRQRTH